MNPSLLFTFCCSSSSFSCAAVVRRCSPQLLKLKLCHPSSFVAASTTICTNYSARERRFLATTSSAASTAAKMAPPIEAQNFVSFMNKSPSPFHAVAECVDLLTAAGFTELKESDSWNVSLGGCHYVKKNESTIIAFAVGKKFKPGNGFSIVGAHTDSPCLRVKPVSKKKEKDGYIQVGVECYGGGIWHTWFDRDLKIAGRVLVKTAEGKLHHRLVHVDRPILRIPNLAIHLDRTTNEKFSPNKETHLCPVLATVAMEELSKSAADTESPSPIGQAAKHHPILVKLICDQLGVAADQLMDFELCLADAAPAVIGGAFEEFIFSPRLDNLVNAYTSTVGLVQSLGEGSLDEEENIRMISLFDNEEVGSQSAQGAESMFQEHVLRRLTSSSFGLNSANPSDAFETAVAKSLMVSADQAHAVHPNYGEKHEENHRPAMHKGVVIKFNANQRYATTAVTTSMLRQIADQAGVPLQDFVVRNDSPCGSTIGPIMSARLGMATIDIGAPQLSMHSIREMGCSSTIKHCIDLYAAFFKNYPTVFKNMVY